ncbi:MAG: hypothetical protein PPFGHCPK_01096 [Spiroplasma endosymbiont of Drosophila atripex]|nr:MAG: hypothetical protein PPFGHCPK_01096 [Spiroplasma endosymbiont of Drosophila atripex]
MNKCTMCKKIIANNDFHLSDWNLYIHNECFKLLNKKLKENK